MSETFKAFWTDSFVDCDDSDCVTDNLCARVTSLFGDAADNQSVYDNLYSRCKNEAWRFSDFIMDGSFEHFEFDIVPMSTATCD